MTLIIRIQEKPVDGSARLSDPQILDTDPLVYPYQRVPPAHKEQQLANGERMKKLEASFRILNPTLS